MRAELLALLKVRPHTQTVGKELIAVKQWPWFLILLAALCISLIAGQASQQWKAPDRASRRRNPIASEASSISFGKAIYEQQCLDCHGPSGKGDGKAAGDLDPKPRDLASPFVIQQTDGALFWKISHGREPMPAFEKLIPEDQRWHVINYVRTFAPKSATTQP